MKILGILGLAWTLTLPLAAFGQGTVPQFVTYRSSGTTTSWVQIASSPMQQCRVVQAIASSDLAGANLLFSSGVTPVTVTYSNALGTTVSVGYTNGFGPAGQLCTLERAGTILTNMQIASFTGSTNIVFTYNIPATVPGDQIYTMSTPVKLWVGVFTNRPFSGEAVYVGNKGRPVQVLLNGTSACSIDALTVKFE